MNDRMLARLSPTKATSGIHRKPVEPGESTPKRSLKKHEYNILEV